MWPRVLQNTYCSVQKSILIILAVLAEVISEQGHVFITVPANININDLTGFSRIQYGGSRIACAIQCEKEMNCQTFSFDEPTQTCRMGDIAGGVGWMGKRKNIFDCPANYGFTMHIDATLSLCLKIYLTGEIYNTAQSTCEGYGGHLLVVNNATVHQLAKMILPSGIGRIWIDGKDVYGTDIMFSYTGKRLEWTSWGLGDPDGSIQDCLSLNSGDDFYFYDSACATQCEFVCQID